MEKFTNVNIKKEKKRLTRNILISILVIIVGIAFIVWSYVAQEEAKNNVKNLNDIIENEEQKEEKIASLSIHTQPYLFAEETEGANGYFIAMDDKYMYIVYMSKYDELATKTDLKENPINVVGGTKLISQDIKQMAIDAYNEGAKEGYKITMADFASYFGDVYLDITSTGTNDIGEIQLVLGAAFGLLGIIMFITNLVQKIKFNGSIKKMDEVTAQTLDDEMNSQDAFYYDRIHLYLTNNYIINFKGIFRVINYQDIIWMYSMIYRTNGIKTNQSIKVMTKEGKTYEIALIDIATKAKKEIYEEIWNTIISKNNRIILGYTKEAQEEAKSRIEN